MEIGIFHPILVHFSVALFMFAFICDGLRIIFHVEKALPVAHLMIIIGTVMLLPTIVTGLFAAERLPPTNHYLILHKDFALGTAALASVHALIRICALKKAFPFSDKWFLVLSTMTMIAISFTGDMGGLLTHGKTPFFSIEKNINPFFEDPHKVRLLPPTELKTYLENHISNRDIALMFERYQCAGCHSQDFADPTLANFSQPNETNVIWLPRNKEGKLEDWEKSPLYKTVILNNRMPLGEDQKTIGMTWGDRLVLLDWIKNGASIEALAPVSAPPDESEEEESS